MEHRYGVDLGPGSKMPRSLFFFPFLSCDGQIPPKVVTSTHNMSRLATRRGPYALRACDACRRRKGKCDGNQPCGHCIGRERECHFSSTSSTAVQDHEDDHGVPGIAQGNEASLVDLVASLQRQLDTLASRVNSSDIVHSHGGEASHGSQRVRAPPQEPPRRQPPSPSLGRNFCGPTSPDYSLNMAQMKLRQRSHSHSLSNTRRPTIASMDEDAVYGEETDGDHADGGMSQASTASWPSQQTGHLKLLYFRTIIGTEDGLRLLRSYQDLVGDLHPIVNLEELASHIRTLCTGPASGVGLGENELLILNLVLAIALRAESMSATTDLEVALQSRFQDALNAKLAAPATSIKDVVIVLLAVSQNPYA